MFGITKSWVSRMVEDFHTLDIASAHVGDVGRRSGNAVNKECYGISSVGSNRTGKSVDL